MEESRVSMTPSPLQSSKFCPRRLCRRLMSRNDLSALGVVSYIRKNIIIFCFMKGNPTKDKDLSSFRHCEPVVVALCGSHFMLRRERPILKSNSTKCNIAISVKLCMSVLYLASFNVPNELRLRFVSPSKTNGNAYGLSWKISALGQHLKWIVNRLSV